MVIVRWNSTRRSCCKGPWPLVRIMLLRLQLLRATDAGCIRAYFRRQCERSFVASSCCPDLLTRTEEQHAIAVRAASVQPAGRSWAVSCVQYGSGICCSQLTARSKPSLQGTLLPKCVQQCKKTSVLSAGACKLTMAFFQSCWQGCCSSCTGIQHTRG